MHSQEHLPLETVLMLLAWGWSWVWGVTALIFVVATLWFTVRRPKDTRTGYLERPFMDAALRQRLEEIDRGGY
jgi:hypothetical protein